MVLSCIENTSKTVKEEAGEIFCDTFGYLKFFFAPESTRTIP